MFELVVGLQVGKNQPGFVNGYLERNFVASNSGQEDSNYIHLTDTHCVSGHILEEASMMKGVGCFIFFMVLCFVPQLWP